MKPERTHPEVQYLFILLEVCFGGKNTFGGRAFMNNYESGTRIVTMPAKLMVLLPPLYSHG